MNSWSNLFGGTSLGKTSFKGSWCCQFLPLMFCCATPMWWRDRSIGVHQQKLHQTIYTIKKTSHHLELWVKSSSHSRGRCPGCQDFTNFRGALQQLPKLTAYSPKKARQTCLLLKPFSHLAKGGCPCYKTPSPPSSWVSFVKRFSYKLMQQECCRSKRSCYLCSCEFIRIRKKEPLVPPSSCSTVPAFLCGLVPVGVLVASVSHPQTYGLHPTLTGIKLVIPVACS